MKALSLISGGLDSPVAAYMLIKNGLDVSFVYFDNYPFSEKAGMEKTKKIVRKLSKTTGKKLKLSIVQNGKNQKTIFDSCERKLMCILCRRMMYRIAEKLASQEKAFALITGEVLGQKASQTLENLFVIDKAIKMPVLRPLIGFDKEEITKMTKEIGVYELSSLPGDCCSLVPQYPATKSRLKRVEESESRLDMEKMIKDSAKNARVLFF